MIQIMILGCKKQATYLEEAQAQQKDADPSQFRVLTLVGDPLIDQTYLDISTNQIVAKCEDLQDVLSLKVREGFAQIFQHMTDCEGVWKTDDDIRIAPKELPLFYKGLLDSAEKPQLGLFTETIHTPFVRSQDQKKCYSQPRVRIRIPACRYSYGWGYYLRQDHLSMFIDPKTLAISQELRGQEDVATGAMMTSKGVYPVCWDTLSFAEIKRGGGILRIRVKGVLSRRGTWEP